METLFNANSELELEELEYRDSPDDITQIYSSNKILKSSNQLIAFELNTCVFHFNDYLSDIENAIT